MRELKIGIEKETKVYALEEAGQENVCSDYDIRSTDKIEAGLTKILGSVSFQKGAIQEHGVNGIQNENLLAIVIDRLEGFQSGEFACNENHLALIHCRNALEQLNIRTRRRREQGVEGKDEQHKS